MVKLVFDNVSKPGRGPVDMDVKDIFVNALRRQKTAYDQIEVQGKPTAIDSADKTIRPLWWIDPTDGVVRFGLRWGISKMTINGGYSLKVGKLKDLPSYLDALIDATQNGDFDKDLKIAQKKAKRK